MVFTSSCKTVAVLLFSNFKANTYEFMLPDSFGNLIIKAASTMKNAMIDICNVLFPIFIIKSHVIIIFI